SAPAAIYVAAAPLCVAVLAHLLVKGERLTWQRGAGVLTGFAGVSILFVPGLLAHDAIGVLPVGPQLMLLAAAFFYAVSGILVRISGLAVQPLALAFGFCTCAAVMSVPLAVLSGEVWPFHVAAGPIWAVAGLGVFSTGVGALVYVLAIRGVGAVFTTNVGNLAPFWSLLVGALMLDEHLPVTAFAGLLLIFAGIVLVQLASRSGGEG
ncbi:MAG: DMT family transporter, partial [Hyphomonadaceae bacterium]|nr:DMT family transporter [Hyphomonadaceae bacterium]